MTLRELLGDGPDDVEITGLAFDNRKVEPGTRGGSASVASSGSGGAPSARAAAQAPSALRTLKRPGMPSRTGHSPSGVRRVKLEPAASGRTSSARRSASSSMPNVTVPGNSAASRRPCASSAEATRRPGPVSNSRRLARK